MIQVAEKVIAFREYLHQEGDETIHIWVDGFAPVYNPICCIKGQPATMRELIGKLEDTLGVCLTASTPCPPLPQEKTQ